MNAELALWEDLDTIRTMWVKSFEEAKQQASKENKPIFLDFYAPD